jgi:hypothetical protein
MNITGKQQHTSENIFIQYIQYIVNILSCQIKCLVSPPIGIHFLNVNSNWLLYKIKYD